MTKEDRDERLVWVAALTALVGHQTAMMNGDLAQFGSLMWDPRTEEVDALKRHLTELGAYDIIPGIGDRHV